MKTIDEKAKAYADKVFESAIAGTWGELKQSFADAYTAGAAEALASQWHLTAKNDYPDCCEEVFVAYQSRYSDAIYYGVANFKNDKWHTDEDVDLIDYIFAWMYIPEFINPFSHA